MSDEEWRELRKLVLYQISELERDVEVLKGQLEALNKEVAEYKGGGRVILWLLPVVSGIIGFLATVLTKLMFNFKG